MILLTFLTLATLNLSHSESPLPDNSVNPFLTKSQVKKVTDQALTQKKISSRAIIEAFKYFEKNQRKFDFSKQYLAIADFSQPSNKKRLGIINLQTGNIETYKVAHGKGSDPNHDLKIDKFSNHLGSYATPKGFHKMTSTYRGKHGLSLRMQGIEANNKSSEKRAIVLHGADYVSWKHTGRSHGCPAVEKKYSKKIIEQLKGGALFYHFK